MQLGNERGNSWSHDATRNNLNESSETKDFIRAIIDEDIASGRYGGKVQTRFPPEPNGYLHIGHAKSIYLNFTIAAEYGGKCNLRFDDTNPSKEDKEYVEAIKRDIKWLGFDWEDREYYASDYFDRLYEWAEKLVREGKAYVDSQSPEEIKRNRGDFNHPGKDSPYRNRSPEENIDLLRRMKAGEFPEGSHVLRAKIDMKHKNMNMRDPIMYRIIKRPHHRTGDKWCIYPTYDWAHGQSDSIEGITHSICTLEFEDHRPLYDWFLDQLEVFHSRQIEFARLNLSYTVMSKRKLLTLVQRKIVEGWDDPRMPTISGLRRRGYTPESIKEFCKRIGVAKRNSVVDIALLEHCLREDLNKRAPRRMAVLSPLRLVIENYPDGKVEEIEAENNPEDPSAGTRKVPFSKVLYIEKDDFRENPPRDYFRLSPGSEVRLKHAYYIKCVDFKKDPDSGEIVEVRCIYDPATRGGGSEDGRKVRGTLHWVSAPHAFTAEVRIYDYLFSVPEPDQQITDEDQDDLKSEDDFLRFINPNSLKIIKDSKLEPSLQDAKPEERFQFLRQGYFCVDTVLSSPKKPVFNRIVTLKDTWAKIEAKKKTINSKS